MIKQSIPIEKAIYAIYCYTCKVGMINLNHQEKEMIGTTVHVGHRFSGARK